MSAISSHFLRNRNPPTVTVTTLSSSAQPTSSPSSSTKPVTASIPTPTTRASLPSIVCLTLLLCRKGHYCAKPWLTHLVLHQSFSTVDRRLQPRFSHFRPLCWYQPGGSKPHPALYALYFPYPHNSAERSPRNRHLHLRQSRPWRYRHHRTQLGSHLPPVRHATILYRRQDHPWRRVRQSFAKQVSAQLLSAPSGLNEPVIG